MGMVFCRGCGKEIHDSAITCPHCGAQQKALTSVSSQQQEDNLPDGIRGWSWGAFFLTWIWAIGNSTWIGLLALIPYVNFVMMIVLGIKGREWAWKNTHWDSVEHFNRVQAKWSFWGVLLFMATIVIALIALAVIGAAASQHRY